MKLFRWLIDAALSGLDHARGIDTVRPSLSSNQTESVSTRAWVNVGRSANAGRLRAVLVRLAVIVGGNTVGLAVMLIYFFNLSCTFK